MKSLTIILFLLTSGLFGQVILDKGIYRGQKFPFYDCYLNVKDTTSTVELFYLKGGQYFGYSPTKKLFPVTNPKNKTLVLADKHDSVLVYKDKSKIKVKFKGNATIKLYLTNLNDSAISKNINNNMAFRYYQDTYEEVKTSPKFNDSIYNKIRASYNMRNFYNINNTDFKSKCVKFKTEAKTKFGN